MTHRKLIAGAVGALTLAASASLAHAAGDAGCVTFNTSKNSSAVVHCVGWTHEMAARLKAAGCDPQHMTLAEMRGICADLMAHADAPASGGAA
jgi:hypothetical protein